MTATMQLDYTARLAAMRERRQSETLEKQRERGFMDMDDFALVLPPPEIRQKVETVSGSGVPMVDILMNTWRPVPNHPSGGFFGPRSVGENFRGLLEVHPVYIDPMSSLAGAYMVNFMTYRTPAWNPDIDYSDIAAEHERYGSVCVVGGVEHMCQDMTIGMELGFGGLLDKVRHYRGVNPGKDDFYDGLEHIVLGMQNFVRRHADAAAAMAGEDGPMRQNLLEMAAINRRLVTEPPRTFREACQWILWYQTIFRMYNLNGSLGRLDVMLLPYYQADPVSHEEAIFHIACHLLRDTAYVQVGGPDAAGNDVTNPVSYFILEAVHRMRLPANVGVCVGRQTDPGLLRRGVEILLEDRCGSPKFLGVDNTVEGFARNGFPLELSRQRAYSGCHWSSLPGREYSLQDIAKINFAVIFDAAWHDLIGDPAADPGLEELWRRFVGHMNRALDAVRRGLDFQFDHMHEVFPELLMDLLCHGPLEKGLDASNGGVEFSNFCVDGAGLATVADSFAAIQEQVERRGRLTWRELAAHLESDWAGPEGARARALMRNSPRFSDGVEGSLGHAWAERIVGAFSAAAKDHPTPKGFMLVPGLFSWALNLTMGRNVGATPNGRGKGAPISHGANPDPGARKDGAPTAMAVAVAGVQPGYGNTAPLQLDLDPTLTNTPADVQRVAALIRGHFDLGGTQINMNVLNREQVLEAHRDPFKFPDLIVRVTGFSAYFASLSPEMRQFVVDRIVSE